MRLIITLIIFASFFISACAQMSHTFDKKLTVNEASRENPFGKRNPKAPPEIKDFEKLIGECNCKSLQYANGKPGDTLQLKWRWKYILNGFGVQDEGWYGNDSIQSTFTSIRVLNPKTKKWHVPFFTPNMIQDANIWVGSKEGDKIILKRKQKLQNNVEAESVLTFSNISDKGYDWTGKMVMPNGKEHIFWQIWCVKVAR